MDKNGRPLPGTARQAIDQGKYVAYAIARLLQNQQPKPYNPKNYGYIIPLGGKWAVFKSQYLYLKGFFPYLMRLVAWLHYFYTIVGISKAFQLMILKVSYMVVMINVKTYVRKRSSSGC